MPKDRGHHALASEQGAWDVLNLLPLQCIDSFLFAPRNPELEKRRALAESNIRKTLPKLKQQMLKAETITACQVSGEPLLSDAEVHHIERQADQPCKSLDPNNRVLISPPEHQAIHNAGALSPKTLATLA